MRPNHTGYTLDCKTGFWRYIEGIEFFYGDLDTKHTQTLASFLGSVISDDYGNEDDEERTDYFSTQDDKDNRYLQHKKRAQLLLSEYHESITFRQNFYEPPCLKAITENLFAILHREGCSYIKIDFSHSPLDIALEEATNLARDPVVYICHKCNDKTNSDNESIASDNGSIVGSDDDDINSIRESRKWYSCNMQNM